MSSDEGKRKANQALLELRKRGRIAFDNNTIPWKVQLLRRLADPRLSALVAFQQLTDDQAKFARSVVGHVMIEDLQLRGYFDETGDKDA